MSNTEVETLVSLDLRDFTHSMSREQKLELVKIMCDNERDLGFDMEIVRLVVKGIKEEYTNGTFIDPEFKQFVKSLKKV